MDEEFRSETNGLRFLVLLGLSDAEVDIGLGALQAADLPFREVKRAHFQGKLWAYTAVLTETKQAVKP